MSLIDRLTNKKKEPKNAGKVSVTKKDEKASSVKEKTDATAALSLASVAHKTIIRPVVTEKSTVAQSANTYTFMVNRAATKLQIKQAIKELYGVAAKKIRTILIQGKTVRFSKGYGRRSDYKKALVTVEKGSELKIHEGV